MTTDPGKKKRNQQHLLSDDSLSDAEMVSLTLGLFHAPRPRTNGLAKTQFRKENEKCKRQLLPTMGAEQLRSLCTAFIFSNQAQKKANQVYSYSTLKLTSLSPGTLFILLANPQKQGSIFSASPVPQRTPTPNGDDDSAAVWGIRAEETDISSGSFSEEPLPKRPWQLQGLS